MTDKHTLIETSFMIVDSSGDSDIACFDIMIYPFNRQPELTRQAHVFQHNTKVFIPLNTITSTLNICDM